MKNWLIKLWKDGVRYRSLRWVVPIILPSFHLSHNPKRGERRKKGIVDINKIAEEMGYESPLDDQISNEYRTSHLGKFPGKNMGD